MKNRRKFWSERRKRRQYCITYQIQDNHRTCQKELTYKTRLGIDLGKIKDWIRKENNVENVLIVSCFEISLKSSLN